MGATAFKIPPPDDEPGDLMVQHWISRPKLTDSWEVVGVMPKTISREEALLLLRAAWAGVVKRNKHREALAAREHVKSSDAPWWCYDPSSDSVHRVRGGES